jgi:RNA polymerase sigma factor (sigma-70 family)
MNVPHRSDFCLFSRADGSIVQNRGVLFEATALPPPTDQELLRSYAATKSDPAFAELVARHLGWVYGTALRKTRDAALAEDIAQAVFLALSVKSEKLIQHPSLPAWLFTATRLAAADTLRRRARQKEREQMAQLALNSRAADGAVQQEIMDQIDDALAALPKKYRQVILLHFYGQLSLRAIAAQLNASEPAIRKRLTRAIQKLRVRVVPPLAAETVVASISAHVATPAPAHLSHAVLAGKSTANAVALSGILHAPALSATKLAIAGTFCVAVSIAAIVVLTQSAHAPVPAVITSPVAVASQPTTGPSPASASALAGVHTLRTRATITFAGQPQAWEVDEMYLDLDHGQIRREVFSNGTYITRDDGVQALKYREGRTQAVEDTINEQFRSVRDSPKILMDAWLSARSPTLTRESSKDFTLAGERLTCYSRPDDDSSMNNSVWFDSRGFQRQNEYDLLRSTGGPVQHIVNEQIPDPDLPADFWALPPGSKVVYPLQLLEQQFPLASVLFQREVHGTILAVHSVRQSANGNFYLVVSTRMTPETFKALENVHAKNAGPGQGAFLRDTHGRFVDWNERTQKFSHAFDDSTIASVYTEGIRVDYIVIIPHTPDTFGSRCHLTYVMTPMNSPAEMRQESPVTQQHIAVDLQNTQPLIDIKTFGTEAYALADQMDGLAQTELNTNSTPMGRRLKQSRFLPGQITQSEFLQSLSRDEGKQFGWH